MSLSVLRGPARGILIQAALLVALVATGMWLWSNAEANMAARAQLGQA